MCIRDSFGCLRTGFEVEFLSARTNLRKNVCCVCANRLIAHSTDKVSRLINQQIAIDAESAITEQIRVVCEPKTRFVANFVAVVCIAISSPFCVNELTERAPIIACTKTQTGVLRALVDFSTAFKAEIPIGPR